MSCIQVESESKSVYFKYKFCNKMVQTELLYYRRFFMIILLLHQCLCWIFTAVDDSGLILTTLCAVR